MQFRLASVSVLLAIAGSGFGRVAAAETVAEAIAAADAEVKAVTGRVQLLEDQDEIENLQRIYGYYVDKARWQDAADLFADDATLEIGGRGVFVGKARVLEYLTYLSPQGLTSGQLFEHLQLQPIVDVAPDGRTAQGRWRFLAMVGKHQQEAMWGTGVYENEYVKQGDVWKIAKLHGYFTMYAPYTAGWGKEVKPNTRPEQDLPPDQPPSVVYDAYPSVFVAPFHYRHPVRGN